MKILFLSYWGLKEGLTSSTVIPNLKILSDITDVEKIVFCSIERSTEPDETLVIPKVIYQPLRSVPQKSVLLTKYFDFVRFPAIVRELCEKHAIDVIFSRSPLAGAIAYMVSRRIRIPYIVESFEPHAVSMRESGVWKWWDVRYWLGKYFESQEKKTAKIILPVSNHYYQELLRENVDSSRLMLMPCCVDREQFAFNNSNRIEMRRRLQLDERQLVGIYVGKFGGIYHDEAAFQLFSKAFDHFRNYHFAMTILTPDDHQVIRKKLSDVGIPLDKVVLRTVGHDEVPDYLSASDFAFSTIKPVPSRRFCSPIKNGEYWANGLPIITEQGIGDDSDIIAAEEGGAIVEMEKPALAFKKIEDLLRQSRLRLSELISPIAQRHRSFDLVREVYTTIIRVLILK